MGPVSTAGWVNNAHKVGSVTIYYQNHPFYMRELRIVRFNKGKEVLVKAPDGTMRGVPVWMTDRIYCMQIRNASNPQCSWNALLRLRRLLDYFDFDAASKSGDTQTDSTDNSPVPGNHRGI